MKWKELRGIYFPLCMEEIGKVKTKYLSLINQVQKQNLEKDRKALLELRKSIEQRVIEIDNFIEENFDKQFVLHFEKCKIKLKKLLQINLKEKLSKQNLSKIFHDVDCLNKLIKKHQEKESQKLKMKDEPIYNQLPVDYGLYEGIIEEMKIKDLKNKIYLNPNSKYLGDVSISDENQSEENSFSNNNNNNTSSANNKNLRLTFGNNSKNFFVNNSNSEKNTKSSKSKSLQVISEK